MAQAVAGTCRYLALDGAPLEAPAPAGGAAGEGASPAKLKGKKAKEARQAARAQAGEGGGGGDHVCNVCKGRFPSRSKLFDHIKHTGHALYDPSNPASLPKGAKGSARDADGKGKKKKK